MGKTKLKPFDKYYYYMASVQSPDTDAEFLRDTYKKIHGKKPSILREDFCGTFALCCEWIKDHDHHHAMGVDLDEEPLSYGKEHYLTQLKPEQKKRLQLFQKNVFDAKLTPADILCALNFSYFCIKERAQLKKYFTSAYEGLQDKGIFVIDCFGGSKCQEANEEEIEFEDENFSYFWDQSSFDPISHEAQFYIHFKRDGEKRQNRAFSYDWRMWTIPELRDIMAEVGFDKSVVYWEGTDAEGEGDGNYTQTTVGEECEAWVAYIVGVKG